MGGCVASNEDGAPSFLAPPPRLFPSPGLSQGMMRSSVDLPSLYLCAKPQGPDKSASSRSLSFPIHKKES